MISRNDPRIAETPMSEAHSRDPSSGAADLIRDAATLILLRRTDRGPAVLMGMRGAGAAFMARKFVFPGGAVDAGDRSVRLATALDPATARQLADGTADPALPQALAAAAIRELWEEAGLALALPGDWPDPPADWAGFAARRGRPAAGSLRFIFRAVTPAGRPRRFDARFFLAPAEAVLGDPDDFGRAGDELSYLQWVPLAEARGFDLPFITEVVLAEVAGLAAGGEAQAGVPFFDNSGPRPLFRRIG